MADVNKPVCTIYAIIDPDTGHLRYVGQTRIALWRRLADHIAGASRSQVRPVLAWIYSVYESGKEVKIIPLEENAHSDREKFWIAKLFSEGAPLLNVEYCGERRSEISIRKMANPETKERHRQATRAALKDPERRTRMSVSLSRVAKSPEHKQALGNATRARAKDPQKLAVMQNVARNLSGNEKRKSRSAEAHRKPEFRALMAERTRNNLDQNPVIRERISEGCRKSWARRKAAKACHSS